MKKMVTKLPAGLKSPVKKVKPNLQPQPGTLRKTKVIGKGKR